MTHTDYNLSPLTVNTDNWTWSDVPHQQHHIRPPNEISIRTIEYLTPLQFPLSTPSSTGQTLRTKAAFTRGYSQENKV